MPPDPEKFQFNWKVHKLTGFLQIPDISSLMGVEEPEDENPQDGEDAMDVDPVNNNNGDDDTANQNPDPNRSLEEIYDVPLHPSEY